MERQKEELFNNDNSEVMPLQRFINAKSAKEYVEVIRGLSSIQRIKNVVTYREEIEHPEMLGDFELLAEVDIVYGHDVSLTVQIMNLNNKQYFSLQSDIKEYNLVTIDTVLIFVKTAQFLAECNMGIHS